MVQFCNLRTVKNCNYLYIVLLCLHFKFLLMLKCYFINRNINHYWMGRKQIQYENYDFIFYGIKTKQCLKIIAKKISFNHNFINVFYKNSYDFYKVFQRNSVAYFHCNSACFACYMSH